MTDLLKASHIAVTLGDAPILKDCSLTAYPGEFIGIIGPNGAGKSTFLKACRGLIPHTGSVSFLGRDAAQLHEKDIARSVAFMQQDFHAAFGYTCEEIVLSARYPYLAWWQGESARDKDIARQCMAFTGVSHLAKKEIQAISGGERQRVLLAKVLAQESPLLFLDEPTASLDLLYQEEIFRLCQHLAGEGKTILMICHDLMMAARWCSRLVLIAHGSILADGTPSDVLTEAHLKEAFGLHAIVYTDPISGEPALYTYQKAELKKKRILLLGSDLEAAALIRLLFTHGYPARCGVLPAGTIAREAAKDFHTPCLQEGEEGKLPALLQETDLVLCYGADKEIKQRIASSAEKLPVYTPVPMAGAETISFEAMAEKICNEEL